MPDVIYQYGADIGQILAALNQIDKTNEKVYKKAEQAANKAIKGIISDHQRLLNLTKQLDKSITDEAKAFEKLGKEAARAGQDTAKGFQASGVQIGAVSGVVQALTQRIISLGQESVRAFVQFNKEAVGLASELETTGAVFEGIFQGNEAAAVATLQRVRKESRGLGVDLQETARAFLPFVENLNQLSKVGEIAAALATSQPEQGETGARIALQEFLSGNAGSLVRRFEIPRNLGKELNEALATGGVEAGLNKLDEILTRMGRSIDQLGDTFQFSLGKARISAEQLQTAFGVPITEELKSQLDELNKVVEANFDDFEGLATLAGNVIAEIAGAADLSGIVEFFADNKQDIAEFLTALQEIVKSAKEFADIDLSKGINVNALTDAALKIDKIVNAINTIKTITESADTSSFMDGLTAGIEGLFPLYTAFIEIWENLDKVIIAVIGTYGLFVATATAGQAVLNNAYQEFLAFTGQIEESQKKLIDPQKAYTDSVAETNKAIAEYKANVADAAAAVDNATIPTKENTEAGEEQAAAFLEQAAAARELAEAEEEAAAAQAKIDKAFADAKKDFDRKLEDIDIQTERKRLDIQIEFAQKREDAAEDNLEKLADIRRKHQQDITDAATDLEREEEDIARKFANERIDLETDQRQKRVDIEKSFREKLQDIQKESETDLIEAERKRDAVAFLRILRQRNEKVTQAQTDRQRDLDELRLTGERRKEELRIQQQRELEEAAIQNERKLEDLRLNLERQIEAQNIAYDRQLADIAEAEQRKNEELARARERDIEDAKRAYERKLEDLKASLEAELKLIEEFAAKKAALLAQIASLEAGIKKPPKSAAPIPPSLSKPKFTGEKPLKDVPGFQHGGGFTVGGSGGADSQLVQFRATPGERVMIAPSSPLVLPNFGGGSAINNINASKHSAPTYNFPVGDASLFNDPIFTAKLRNVLLSTLNEVL